MIGNERRMDEDTSDIEVEPKVAARMQLLNDQSFHQFTNLKIMKSDDGGEKKPRRKLSPPKKIETIAKDGRDPRIYSQDFRTLKILPADTINFNEIELIGEDLYFGDKLQEENEMAPEMPPAITTTEDSPLGNEDVVVPSNEIKEVHDNQTVAHEGELDNLLLGSREDQRNSATTAAEDRYLDELVIANTVTVPGEDEDVNTRGGKLLLGSEDGDDYSRVEDLDEYDDDYYYDDEYEILHRNKGQRKYKR